MIVVMIVMVAVFCFVMAVVIVIISYFLHEIDTGRMLLITNIKFMEVLLSYNYIVIEVSGKCNNMKLFVVKYTKHGR